MSNLILIGMPGVGKTTVGKRVACELGWRLLDVDAVIEGRTDKPLSQVVAELGTEKFCDLEALTVQSLWCDQLVIAPGGSVVYREAAMVHLKRLGSVIYLEANLEELARRIAAKPDRGIVWFGQPNLKTLWQERHPLYQKYADLVIHQDGMSLTDCSQAICAAL
ncbi:MAG: shikimate kinase [Candidatus Buchananbacteria bacterium]|nr:shikimate kinase [Candidatus Buchananbacteria bacterium]